MVAWPDAVARVERWILPGECLTCHRPAGTADPLICDVCRARWRRIAEPVCGRCGESLPLGLACRVCVDWPPELGPVRSAVRLDAPVRRAVHQFKYRGWWRLAGSFAERMAPVIRDWPDGDLVPVALSRRRQWRRGYNQAESLALALGHLTGRPVRADRLRRDRDTPTQTRLTPEQRRANLASAFSAGVSIRPAILVDDVFTTGATLCSAATELLDRGAESVAAITFARAELPLSDLLASAPAASLTRILR
jgi:ComF family protein